ncbi:MAG: hypothetical protein KIT16_23230, partial [Rhodospirillaceae bacterium]|nr:hypothetical protein [Rhodospirillaceae bacterium]
RAATDGRWLSPLTRRISDPSGRFVGVVSGVLDSNYLNSVLNRFRATNGASYALVLSSAGAYLARSEGSNAPIGQSAAANNLLQIHLPKASNGSYRAQSNFTGEQRLYSYRKVKNYPVVVVASFARSAALAGWYERLRLSGGFATLIVVGAVIATLLILNQTRKLEQQRVEAFDARLAAEHANRAKTEFLAHMSHEMRTPMNAILGFTEMMSKEVFGPVGSPKYKEYLGHVATSGQHLLQVINNILDLAKVEAGKWVMEEELVDVGRLVADTLQLVGERARAAGVRLEADKAGPPLILQGDPRLLRQILLNLVVNGIKFTEHGGRVRVAWRLEETGAAAIAVSDTGCGMSAGDIARVFEPFGRGSAELARARHDTGLGLPICKRFAEMHGGALEIASVVGKGSIFTLILPKERARPLPAEPAKASREAEPARVAAA